ncbi:hypothetical protein F0562_018515 [Nyssa sinensis]|uniref:DUF2921 domain-containing protein n=1 Tax=Nyssa sinensis TaxID=561372 RepID=A0A5J4Z9N6_9ASTE|nr:hypothetical protein F0562_018515 [Nyssa sinensis]
MWSNTSMDDSGYFGRIVFQNSANRKTRLQGLKYEYTEIDNVRRSCMKKMKIEGKEGTYPDGYLLDMRFDMTVRNRKGKIAWGYSSPLSVGDIFYNPHATFARPAESAVDVNSSHGSMLNISYVISYTRPPDFKQGGDVLSTKSVDISAEGIYDAKTGVLCMIGCRHLGSLNRKLPKNNSLDSEILVNIQYPSLNAKYGSHVKGTIESTGNFEALFLANRNEQNIFLESGVWLKVNECSTHSVTREKALAPPFYVGTTVVRLLPHAYDLYRTNSSACRVLAVAAFFPRDMETALFVIKYL